ncbi:MAG: epimerase [Acidobacteria bacterium]|nr:MAG: epimerase [Acidobacteriota bacterium]
MYVVAGVTGNTGSVVAKQLLALGKKVRGIGRTEQRLQPFVQKGGEPFVADLTDKDALAEAFAGAEGVYVMIPPNPSAHDFREHQHQVAEAIASALERSNVKHVVSLSSIGADKEEGTGPVTGLHRMEQRLERIPGLNVLHLRAGYFMENTLIQAGIIDALGVCSGPLLPELKIPMIATADIGAAAAEHLLKLDFNSHVTLELQGPRDLSMSEAVSIIGKVIGKPDLKYDHAPDDQVSDAMREMGMSPDLVEQMLEMAKAMNSGHMKALEPRSARNMTPTSYETFVEREFVPRYKGILRAA